MKKWLQRIRGVPVLVLVFFACGGPPVETERVAVPPPPEVSEEPVFTPYEVALLRAIGLTGGDGQRQVWFLMDVEGNVVETVLIERIWRRLFHMMSLNM